MTRAVRLDPEAEAELQDAASFYTSRSNPAGRRFLNTGCSREDRVDTSYPRAVGTRRSSAAWVVFEFPQKLHGQTKLDDRVSATTAHRLLRDEGVVPVREDDQLCGF